MSGKIAPGLTKCSADDSKCIEETTKALLPMFANGFPEYKVDALDPIMIKSVNASQDNLLFTLTDIVVVGFQNCQVTKVKRDVKNSKLYLSLFCLSVTVDGEYELQGSFLTIPVRGKGKLHAHLKSTVIEFDMDLVEKVRVDGKRHWNIKSFTHSYDFKEKSEADFENLNKDNAILRQATKDLLRESTNEIIKETANPAIVAILTRVVKSFNKFFKALSIEDLSLEQS